MEKGIKKFIATKKFYTMALAIIMPIIAQQLFVSVAGYVDSIMVNSFSPEAYAGVSAANRLMFVFSFLFIGLTAAAGIFISQFFGAKNQKKILEAFNISLMFSAVLAVIAFVVIEIFGDRIVDLYIQNDLSRYYGYRYLDVMKWGMIITALNMAVGSAFRSTKETVLPMIIGIIEILINILLNYILIFGHFGAPQLDSLGAAIATIFSRFVSLVVLVIFALTWKKSSLKGFYKNFKVDKNLVKNFFKKGTPLILNELLWSIGIVLLAMFYTYKNDVWYSAYAYSQNISDLFFIFFAGLGNGTAVIVGAALGAGDFDRAIRDSYWLKGLSVIMGVIMGVLMIVFAPMLLTLFTTDVEIMAISVKVMRITAIFVTLYAYNSTCFFILRAGGDSIRAFILDQGATYIISLPIAIVLGINATSLGIALPTIYLISHSSDIIKFFVSNAFVNAKHWVVNLTAKYGIDQPSKEGGNE